MEKKSKICWKNLPHVTTVEHRQQENFLVPGDAYAYGEPLGRLSGFWEISSN